MKENCRFEDQNSFGFWVKWVFQTFFFRLLGVNLVFLISCVPIVTIPAAMCGLHTVIQRLYRRQYASAGISAFFGEFLTSFVKRTVSIWSMLLLPIAVMIFSGDMLPRPIWFSLSGLILVAVLLILSWFVPQLVLLNLSTKQALKNALLLTGIESKTNFALITIHVVSLTVMIYGLPATGFLLLILPVLHVVLTTGITMPVLQRYLVLQEESQNAFVNE